MVQNPKDSLFTANHLTPVRWVLALMVMLGHAWFVTEGYEPIRLHDYTASYMAVNGFFILSGLLITKSLVLGRSKFNYTKSRLLRIMPGLAFILVVYVLVIAPLFTQGPVNHTDFAGYALRVLMMGDPEATPGVIFADNPKHVFNGALWTIRFEILAYFMAAGLVWTKIVRSPATAIGVWLGLTISDLIAPSIIDHGGLLSALRLCSAFSFGMVLWYVPALRRPSWMLVGLGGLAFLTFGWTLVGEILANLALTGLMLKLGLPQLASPTVQRLPDWSYGIYLWHYPAMQILLSLQPSLSPLEVFLFGLPPTLLMAMISWHAVEKTALRLKSARLPFSFTARKNLPDQAK